MVSIKMLFTGSGSSNRNPYTNPQNPHHNATVNSNKPPPALTGTATRPPARVAETAPRLPERNASVSTFALDPHSPISPLSPAGDDDANEDEDADADADSLAEARRVAGRDPVSGKRVYPGAAASFVSSISVPEQGRGREHARNSVADRDELFLANPANAAARRRAVREHYLQSQEDGTAYQRTSTLHASRNANTNSSQSPPPARAPENQNTRYDLLTSRLRTAPKSKSKNPLVSVTEDIDDEISAYRKSVVGVKRYDKFVREMKARREAGAFKEPVEGYYAPPGSVVRGRVEYYTPGGH